MEIIKLSPENHQALIAQIKKFFQDNRDEHIGDLAAELFLDFVIKELGPLFYNQGLADAHQFIEERLSDLFALEKS